MFIERLMNLVPNSLMPIFPVVVMNRWPWRKIMRQHSPGAAGANQVQNSIDNLSQVSGSQSATRLGWWKQRLDQFPLFIRQIAGVGFSVHILLIGHKPTFHTLSERNCYDLEARRGPIFVATISYLETDETTERYFILVDAKDRTVVRKYLDEIVTAKKKGIQAIAMEKNWAVSRSFGL